ncbi:MAG: hypothetical protein CBR30_01030 [Dictyoglomus sp. NZ13-RE01]|nr:MAG: hypothetical protein CBR30_01030 [Dictyoglomus sp. NZ13-RE01]
MLKDSLQKIDRVIIYIILISILTLLLYMLIHIFILLRAQAFIISHDIIINARYALELSILKQEKIVYSFEYSPKYKSALYYWIYGENSKKSYLLPQLVPSGIKITSPTNTYTFYFENGNLYPEGEITVSTYLGKRIIKFNRNGKVGFE